LRRYEEGDHLIFIGEVLGTCSAKMNGLDPYAYLKDVLERLPTHPMRRVEELLPHLWQPATPV
jgi:hypothetical protein